MNIMQVIGGAEKGGSRNHLITLSKELLKKGINVEIVCFTDDIIAQSARENNIPVTVFSMKSIFDIRTIRLLNQHIKKRNPQILHTHGFRANFIGRLAVVFGNGLPVITTVHSSMYYDYSNKLKKIFYHRIEKLTRSFTYKFIAVSEALKKELEKDGISSNKIKVVYNGLSSDFPLNKEVTPFLRKELGIDEETPILISVGRLESVKNYQMLLQAFSTLKQDKISFHGVIVGDGSLLSELKELATSLDIDDSVHFLGFRNDIYELLTEADLFLLTSIMEGFGVVLLEAMAAHTPVVVTQAGGMQEIVKLANNGYDVPVDDIVQFVARIEAIIAQPELKEKLAENGYKALQHYFTTEQFASKTLELYNQVLEEYKNKG